MNYDDLTSNIQQMFAAFRLDKLTCNKLSGYGEPYVLVVYVKIDDDLLKYAYQHLPDGIVLDGDGKYSDANAQFLLNQTSYRPLLSDWLYKPPCSQNDISATDDYMYQGLPYAIPAGVGLYTTTLKTRVIGQSDPDNARIGCLGVVLDWNVSTDEITKGFNEFALKVQKTILDRTYAEIHGAPCQIVSPGTQSISFDVPTVKTTSAQKVNVTATFESTLTSETKYNWKKSITVTLLPEGAKPNQLDAANPSDVYPAFTLYTQQNIGTADGNPFSAAKAGAIGGQTLHGIINLARTATGSGALVRLETDRSDLIKLDNPKSEGAAEKEMEHEMKAKLQQSSITEYFIGSFVRFVPVSELLKRSSGSRVWAPPVSESGTYTLNFHAAGWPDLVSFWEKDFNVEDPRGNPKILSGTLQTVAHVPRGFSDKNGWHQIYYVGSDAHVHNVWRDQTSWHHQDVTALVIGASDPASIIADRNRDIALCRPAGTLPVIHFSPPVLVNPKTGKRSNEYVRELYQNSDLTWSQRTLDAKTTGLDKLYPPVSMPPIYGKPTSIKYLGSGSYCVVYVDNNASDSNLHALHYNAAEKKWHLADLPKDSGVILVGDPCGLSPDKRIFVFARDSKNNIKQWFYDGNTDYRWQYLGDLVPGTASAASSDPFCFIRPANKAPMVGFRRGYNVCLYILDITSNTIGTLLDLTALVKKSDPAADATAYTDPWGYVGPTPDSMAHIYFRNKGNVLCDLYSKDGLNWSFTSTGLSNTAGPGTKWVSHGEHYVYLDTGNRLRYTGAAPCPPPEQSAQDALDDLLEEEPAVPGQDQPKPYSSSDIGSPESAVDVFTKAAL